jgi:hypothetical protein
MMKTLVSEYHFVARIIYVIKINHKVCQLLFPSLFLLVKLGITSLFAFHFLFTLLLDLVDCLQFTLDRSFAFECIGGRFRVRSRSGSGGVMAIPFLGAEQV